MITKKLLRYLALTEEKLELESLKESTETEKKEDAATKTSRSSSPQRNGADSGAVAQLLFGVLGNSLSAAVNAAE